MVPRLQSFLVLSLSASAIPTGAWTSLQHQQVNLAEYPLAVCNDGSPASYYVNHQVAGAGAGGPADHWLVALEGGGFCMSDESCLNRSSAQGQYHLLTTSRYDSAKVPTLSVSKHLTRIPLAMHERVAVIVIRYCSSDMWVGNSSRVVTNAATGATELFQFHGAAIVDAVLRVELAAQGAAPQAVTLFGVSAGALGAASSIAAVNDLFPAAQVNLIMDSPPPFPVDGGITEEEDDSDILDLVRTNNFPSPGSVSNSKVDVFSPFIEWWNPRKDSALLQTAAQTVGRGAVRFPCLLDLVCMLEQLETGSQGVLRIFLIAPLQDLYVLGKVGFQKAFDGCENGDAPPMANFQMRLQNVIARSSVVHKITSAELSVLPTLFAPACPIHGMTTAVFDPPLPSFNLVGWGVDMAGTYKFSTEGFELDAVYDYREMYGSEAFTDVLVDGTSLSDAMFEFATAIAAENISSDGSYGISRSDTCNGLSCNPTCVGKMEILLATTDLDALRPAFVVVIVIFAVVFLCNAALVLLGRARDRRTVNASAAADGETEDQRGAPIADRPSAEWEKSSDSGTVRVVQFSCAAATKQSDGATKVILEDLSLKFGKGLTAVMGPSGSGKTTLLNAMAGRLNASTLVGSGKIYFDHGIDSLTPAGHHYCDTNTGYVMQLATPWDDSLTCRENLLYAAEIRLAPLYATLSAATTRSRVLARVSEVIEGLDMGAYADTKVGGIGSTGGLSGGQKRKLSVAMQLLRNPKFLFLDEPTSGLDATSTMNLLHMLKSVASHGEGRTIIMTIHQPRVEAWGLFDQVVVVAAGRLCYQGAPKAALAYLSNLFHNDKRVQKCVAESKNPADTLLDSLDDNKHQLIAAAAFKILKSNKANLKRLSVWTLNHLENPTIPASAATLSWGGACALEWSLLYTEHRRFVKSSGWIVKQTVTMSVAFALLIGLFWYRVNSPVGYITGAFVVLLGPWALLCAGVVNALSVHKSVVVTDVEDEVLAQRHFLIPACLHMLSLGMTSSFAMVSITLPMMGPLTGEQYVGSLAVCSLSYCIPECVALMALSFKGSTELGVGTIAIIVNAYMGFFGGFMIPAPQLEDTIGTWILNADSVYCGMILHAKNLLYDRNFECDYNAKLMNCGVGSQYSGETLLIGMGLAKEDNNLAFAVLFVWIFGLMVISVAVAVITSRGNRLSTDSVSKGTELYRQLQANVSDEPSPMQMWSSDLDTIDIAHVHRSVAYADNQHSEEIAAKKSKPTGHMGNAGSTPSTFGWHFPGHFHGHQESISPHILGSSVAGRSSDASKYLIHHRKTITSAANRIELNGYRSRSSIERRPTAVTKESGAIAAAPRQLPPIGGPPAAEANIGIVAIDDDSSPLAFGTFPGDNDAGRASINSMAFPGPGRSSSVVSAGVIDSYIAENAALTAKIAELEASAVAAASIRPGAAAKRGAAVVSCV